MLIVKFIYSSLAFMLKYYYLLRNSWKFSLYTTVIYSKIVGTVCVGCLLESSVLAMGSIKVWIVLKVLCVCVYDSNIILSVLARWRDFLGLAWFVAVAHARHDGWYLGF